MRALMQLTKHECILVYCNESFHRGPVMMAAILLRTGQFTNSSDALEEVGKARIIYKGHFVPYHQWPDDEKGEYNQKLLAAHQWLVGIRRRIA